MKPAAKIKFPTDKIDYLAQARAWVVSLDVVSIEAVESIALHYGLELQKKGNRNDSDAREMKSIRQALAYLNSMISRITGPCGAPNSDSVVIHTIESDNLREIEYDPSSLVNYKIKDRPNVLRPEAKQKIINSLKMNKLIVTNNFGLAKKNSRKHDS
ncbi:MAG: hypothetical protein EOO52_13025 [Gammaproteobacteria bacterium]|nr:MAG: hypothetical protein EOO52_13025 [Gammaproteobacteria bacterium]